VDILRDDDITFNVQCTMRESEAAYFLALLDEMEFYGTIGHSQYVEFYCDGDGAFRPRFIVSGSFSKDTLDLLQGKKDELRGSWGVKTNGNADY